ncbi:MAG TPA: MFS transporter [Burkholderiaceae bacterium]|nr:MFS transporter [Burkholderiaceae bacterium]
MSRAQGIALPVAATLASQVMMSAATAALPVLAPKAAPEIGVPVAWVGLFVAVVYGSSMVCSLPAGALVRRWGAIRLSQLCLLSASAGLTLIATGHRAGAALGAVLIGMGYGPLMPASSHLLDRVAPAHRRATIFSIKQTGVPLGAVLAGAVLPSLAIALGWPAAMLAVGATCVALAALLQPIRVRCDDDRMPDAPLRLGELAEPARLARADRGGWPLAAASFWYAALQLCLGTYLVAYLNGELGYDLVQAGFMLAATQAAGAAGRLLAGTLADRGTAQRVMGAMGCVMGGCALASSFAQGWPTVALLTLYALFGASAIGWNGVYLAEVARRAAPGTVGTATAAALFVTFAGVLSGPAIFSLLIQSGLAYDTAFAAVGLPALACGLFLLRRRATAAV